MWSSFASYGSTASYIDLSTSSYLAQLAVTFILGGLATVVAFWRDIKERVTRAKHKSDSDQDS